MSRENVEIVRGLTDYFNEHGAPGPMEAFDPEVTFTTRGDVGSPQTFAGHGGLMDALGNFHEVWERIEAQLIELIDASEIVVAVIRFVIRSRRGVDLDFEEGWVYWLRGGKVVRIEQHASKAQALEAAGLSE